MVPFSWEDKLVARLAESLALACGLSSKQASLVGDAAELHDVGKFHIPKYILHKPGRLSPEEFEIMKSHTLWGASILSNLCGEFRTVAVNISRLHHEKWDGTGYWKYKGSEIPFYCQIAGVCDVYVALVSANRPYKRGWTQCEALKHIQSGAGTRFCPALAEIFLSLFANTNQSDYNYYNFRKKESA